MQALIILKYRRKMAKSKKIKNEDLETEDNQSYDDSDVLDFEKELQSFLKKDKNINVEVSALSERESVPYWFDTQNYALNWIIGSDLRETGIPGTKVVSVEGDSGTGKSLILGKILGDNVKKNGISYVADTEDAWDQKFVAKIVGDEKAAGKIKIIAGIKTLEDLESLLVKICQFKAAKKDLTRLILAIDSISQLTSDSEIAIAADRTGKVDLKKAQLIKRIFRVIDNELREANITVLLSQHLITNIGVMFGDNKTTSGGTGVGYAADVKLRLLTAKQIQDDKSQHPLGVRLNVKVTKNRFASFGRQCYIDVLFSSGVDRYSGLAELLVRYGVLTSSAKEMSASTKLTFELDAENAANLVDSKVYDKKTGIVSVSYKNFRSFVKDNDKLLIGIFNDRLNQNVTELEETEDILLSEESKEEAGD